ncbi:MAG: hypothetical protein E7E23_22985 [Paenibacillus sp.]|nr:hypothetical protein [Paenibacillus sp.]
MLAKPVTKMTLARMRSARFCATTTVDRLLDYVLNTPEDPLRPTPAYNGSL